MKDQIEKLVDKLEGMYPEGYTPGTNISRVLSPHGIEWCVGAGLLGRPLVFFKGESIVEALKHAVNDFKSEARFRGWAVR